MIVILRIAFIAAATITAALFCLGDYYETMLAEQQEDSLPDRQPEPEDCKVVWMR